MTSGRVVKTYRTFQDHTLDALSSSMALRYGGSNIGVVLLLHYFHAVSPPPSVGGLDFRRHRRAVGAAVRRAVHDDVPGAVEEEAGPAAVRRVPQAFWMRCLYMLLVRFASSL